MSKAVVVVSGGLDSSTLLHHVTKGGEYIETLALSFDYGQRHHRELICAAYQANACGASHRTLPLEFMQFATSALTNKEKRVPTIEEVLGHPQPKSYVPNRNMTLLSIAAGITEDFGASHLFYGAQLADRYGYWDTTPEFLEAINAVFALNRGANAVTVLAPFITYKKADIIHRGLELGVDYSHTYSCYAGREKSCGTCPTCAERRRGFSDLGMRDPLEYEIA